MTLISSEISSEIRHAWEEFVSEHQLHPQVPAMIARSWERCRPLLSPHKKVTLKKLSDDHLLSTQVANFDLLSIARPIMEDIYQYIENSMSSVLLVNSAGFVLDIVSDSEMLEVIHGESICKGAFLGEVEMGTNAFALSIHERVPTRVRGPEHFRLQFHPFAEAAAPIFDLTGKPLGALGVINFEHAFHPHSLGLVVAGARAIEGQRQADILLGEQNSQLALLNAILASITEGILVWNWDGILLHANPAATEILDVSLDSLRGRPMEEHISLPAFVKKAIQSKKELTDLEADITIDGRLIDCIVSLRHVPSSLGMQVIIMTLRKTKEVRRLIQRQVGVQAAFTLDNLIGVSAEIQRVRRLAKVAAAAKGSVFLRGETGTGKNILAHAIHRHGPRRDGPFIVFSCASVPSELINTELLGYEAGINSGQGNNRPGKFELADGGTLFFPDVDALPLEAQAILLNVLELGIVQRQDSRRPIEIDIRVIAATSASLEKLVAEKSFRADLFFRISPFVIELPPLRKRKEDFPLLVENILDRYGRQNGRVLTVDREAMTVLQMYHWPGNIRELEAVLELASIQAGDLTVIQVSHLPEYVNHPEIWFHSQQGIEKLVSLDDMEHEAILRAARYCQGNVTQMAKILGIGRTTLWRKLKQWEIEPNDFREIENHR